MSRRIVNITLDNLGDLPPKCRKCVFWELGPVSRARAEENGDPELEKESWVSSVLLEWGSCGKIAYVDGVPAGYMLFAPPQYVPRSIAFPTSPVSADAVLFMSAHLLSEFAGGGIGRMLVQAMAKDLTRRGVRAIEAFGDRRWDLRPFARITITRGCGWNCEPFSPGAKMSRWHLSACSAQ